MDPSVCLLLFVLDVTMKLIHAADMSPAVFEKFASLDKGVLSNIKWHFNAN